MLALAFLTKGLVYPDEVDSYFKSLDKNGDGFVDLQEFKTWLTAKKTRDRMLHLNESTFQQMDANHDGRISYKEECWCSEDVFRKLDLNHDGFLTRDEAFRKTPVYKKFRQIKQKPKKPKTPKKNP